MYPQSNVMQTRPWGMWQLVYVDRDFATKILTVDPGARLSLQTHEKRDEIWSPLDTCSAVIGINLIELHRGSQYRIPAGTPHRLINDTDRVVNVVEVIVGEYDEEDIFRLEDDWGRE